MATAVSIVCMCQSQPPNSRRVLVRLSDTLDTDFFNELSILCFLMLSTLLGFFLFCFVFGYVMQFSGSLVPHQELNLAHDVERTPNTKHWATGTSVHFLFLFISTMNICVLKL